MPYIITKAVTVEEDKTLTLQKGTKILFHSNATMNIKGTLNVTADKMNLNDWMGTDTTTSTATAASSAPFMVPAGINLTINQLNSLMC